MWAHRVIVRICCTILALGVLSCEKKTGNRQWDQPSGEAQAGTPAPKQEKPAASHTRETPRRKTIPSGAQPVARVPSPAAEPGKDRLRFISYNVENWLTMDRSLNNRTLKGAPKPDAEKKAVIRILVDNAPDVIGICEIGTAADLAEIQESLKASGLNLPHSHHTGGADPERHLGLLSRYPITSTVKTAALDYRMNGKTYGFNRGILDATIAANGKTYHLLGAHLKSKREVEEGDQEQMRIHEAHLLRNHVNAVFQSDPHARLVVYGDFNDTYPSMTVRTITTGTEENQRLSPIYFKDSHGEAWTHHWKNQDIYSRIDFVTLSAAMRSEVDFKACRIIDDPAWIDASDHRPLLTVFK